jgi:hypothetical protein
MKTLAIAIMGMLIVGSGYADDTPERDLSKWNQLGSDFDGTSSSLSLSSDGNIVAIGDSDVQIYAPYTGRVRIYEWNETEWTQLGSDIDGEAAGDASGYSVSLSTDGTIVAIGAPSNDGNGDYSGHVRIYQWSGTEWIQRGSDIDGEAQDDGSGQGVSLSTDGTIVAIGAPSNDGNGDRSGHVRIYQWGGTEWIQRGNDIDGETAGDNSGSSDSVSLSADGNIVAIGASGNDGNGDDSGHVRIYQWNGAAWMQVGDDIDGEAGGDRSGFRLSLSADGSIVAIGANSNGNGEDSGHVRIYQWDGTEWMQRGSDIDGEAGDASSGVSLSLSADGTIVAIGATGNDNRTGINAGRVRIYQWNETEWIQRGNDIDGKVNGDFSGSVVSLSGDGGTVAISAEPGLSSRSDYLSVYRWDATGLLSDDPAHAELVDRINQQQTLVADLQAQITNLSLTQGPQGKVGAAGTNGTDGTQGPQGKVGATGADAPCKPCADVAGAAVDLSCKILDVNPATDIQELRDTAQVIVNTLLISTNICETDCDIGAEINAAIDTKLNQ